MHHPRALALIGLSLTRAVLAQSCTEQWLSGPGLAGPGAQVSDALMWDPDGAGPLPQELVIAGPFGSIGNAAAGPIARWNGDRWLGFGNEPESADALALYDPDGAGPLKTTIAAAARFRTAQGTFEPNVAVWNGRSWDRLPGSTFPVSAMVAFDPDGAAPAPELLLAAGFGPQSLLAWDGSEWGPLGGVTVALSGTDRVNVLRVLDPDGAGPDPGRLFAAGRFESFGHPQARSIALWDGAAWTPTGSGMVDEWGLADVFELSLYDADGPGPLDAMPIAGGNFTIADGVPARGVALWDGAAWSPLPGASQNLGHVSDLLVRDPDGPGPAPAELFSLTTKTFGFFPGIQRWTGSQWHELAAIETVYQGILEQHPALPGGLVAAGRFEYQGIRNAAAWDGQSLQCVAAGLRGFAQDAEPFDDDGPGPIPARMYIADSFRAPGMQSPSAPLARFDGQTLAAVPDVPGEWISELAAFDPDGAGPSPEILAAVANTSQPYSSTMWAFDGQHWTLPLGPGAPAPFGLHGLDADLDGRRELFGSLPVPGGIQLARYDAGQMHPLGERFAIVTPLPSHTSTEIRDLAVYDPDATGPLPPSLVAAGNFNHVGAAAIRGVALWNGQEWADTGFPGARGATFGLSVFDTDGAGPAGPELVVAAGPQVLAWNGSSWREVPSSIFLFASDVGTFDPDDQGPAPEELLIVNSAAPGLFRRHAGDWELLGLFRSNGSAIVQPTLRTWRRPSHAPTMSIFGDIDSAGGAPAGNLALWGCAGPACHANCDGSGTLPILNAADLACFLQKFSAGDPYANCDGSTQAPALNVADFTCFVRRFAAGCP